MVANRTVVTFGTEKTQIQADLKTSGLMFSQLNEEVEEEVEKEGGEERKTTTREVEFEAILDAEVSNWTIFPTRPYTSLTASTQTRGIFVPRVAKCQTEKSSEISFHIHLKTPNFLQRTYP